MFCFVISICSCGIKADNRSDNIESTEVDSEQEASETSESSTMIENGDIETNTDTDLIRVRDNFESDGVSVSISAEVCLPSEESYCDLELTFDSELYDLFCEQLGNCRIDNFSNFFNYLDTEHDINGVDLDGLHLYEPNYFTLNIPNNMNMTSLEACDYVSDYLSQLSDLTFVPYNVIACDNEDSNSSGYYEITYRMYFNDIPVSNFLFFNPETNEMIGGLDLKVFLSNDGIFAMDGDFIYCITDSHPLTVETTFEDVLEQFKEDVIVYSEGSLIEVRSIELLYMPTRTSDGVSLQLVWCFECLDSRVEAGNIVSFDSYYMYSPSDGSFIGVY